MHRILLIPLLVLSLLILCEEGFGQGFYKWVDEKGTVHFSETPPPPKKEEKTVQKENTARILKQLEFGNRTIPEDMKKFGPAGGGSAGGSAQGAGVSSASSRGSTTTRRT